MTSPNPPGPGGPATNVPEYSVSELSQALKRTVEDSYGRVRVRGEISQPKVAASGHCYMRLKDDQAVLDGIIWRTSMSRLTLRPEEGLEVIAVGKLTTYPGRSSYQIVIDSLELAGEGALLKMLEERRKRLAAEGLFAPERKRPIPYLPRVIGVVTSPTGSVIRDILHRIADRFPRHVLVWPVAVQGDAAADQVTNAINGFNALPADGSGPVPRPDVLIVARGGGSLEDLMAFNEESVVRAAAASHIPLISAVGHETDTTLIDYASDLRAPTPTGAAEKAVPVRLDLLAAVREAESRLDGAVSRLLEERRVRVEACARGLPDLPRVVEDFAQRLDDRAERLANAPRGLFDGLDGRVREAVARLRSPRELMDMAAHRVEVAGRSMIQCMRQRLSEREQALLHAGARLRPEPLRADIDRAGKEAARLGRALRDDMDRLMRGWDDALKREDRLLESCSHKSVLNRGFALVRDAEGRVVEDPTGTAPGAVWSLEFREERRAEVTVRGEGAAEPAPSGKKKAPEPKPEPGKTRLRPRKAQKPAAPEPVFNGRQGSLF
ncbi:Exodeoxyribonuclease VII large subunit [Caenispirillum salinarum AK4]|uniref:Exodeoxyribonuclease 7 large subunit n=1 Tax=Caenispirillum salinarum AK4 TaxID=1238182 RepID=K9H5H4_9PROT|nr:exodeoxyribonuclease VII large subunit [Caenispirillum salinarum]EKV32344.1 Exodeoxyribonuclease VII large subunit [Caenispirillum salinarum AK4]